MNDTHKPAKARWRILWLSLFYATILIALIVLHGRGVLEAPSFIYQGF